MVENKAGEADLSSVFTSNLPEILNQLGISLAVSTYQAGKLILVRREGDKTNLAGTLPLSRILALANILARPLRFFNL